MIRYTQVVLEADRKGRINISAAEPSRHGTASPKPGPEFLAECRRYGLDPFAAATLLGVGYRMSGEALGSVAIEAQLRKHGLIATNAEWSGCVDRTKRGDLVADALTTAHRLDECVCSNENASAVRDASSQLANARDRVATYDRGAGAVLCAPLVTGRAAADARAGQPG
jgi:hypothetical protein